MSMHTEAWNFLISRSREINPKSIIDIGGRNINGSPRDLWPNAAYTALDHIKGDGVDIVADATTWVPDRQWDMGLCTEVFEHISPADYRLVLGVLGRAIKHRGVLLITCATDPREPHSAWGTPGMPQDEFYGNVDPYDLRAALQENSWEFIDLIIDRYHGDLYVEAINHNQNG